MTPRLSRYIDLLRQLDNGDGLEAKAFDLSSDEIEDTRGRLSGDLYLVTKIRKYVLLRLDETLAEHSGVTYDFPIITVEHVLPQTPGKDSEWSTMFPQPDRDLWTHKLGNLVLFNRSKNSEAQNYDFDKKKGRYFQGRRGVTTFALTSQVLNHASWTPSVVAQHQADLLDILFKEWSFDLIHGSERWPGPDFGEGVPPDRAEIFPKSSAETMNAAAASALLGAHHDPPVRLPTQFCLTRHCAHTRWTPRVR